MLVKSGEIFVLDATGVIVGEYGRHCTPWDAQRPGDQFLLWLLQAQGDPDRCERVELAETGDERRPFADFPDDPELLGFHLDDHVYVAVARSSVAEPSVLNAVDSDWRDFAEPLARHGVRVDCLCPHCLREAR